MDAGAKRYYQFLGFHSFLIGLLPFFLPVYLYKTGVGLAEIALFIGLSGFSFSLSLLAFDYLRNSSSRLPIALSFVSEVLLLLLLAVDAPWPLLALANGIYSCLYWTIQRILFLAGGTSANSGRRFGNLQIYVLVVLKIGILVGSVLLESFGLVAVCLVSLVVACCGLWFLMQGSSGLDFPPSLVRQKPVTPVDIVTFSDRYNSRTIFVIDGIFLYCESYFWVISLFLFVGESFVRLGGVVVVLALVLACIFLLIKNSIDRANRNRVYQLGVLFYLLSWIVRGLFGEVFLEASTSLQLTMILGIGFATSFFRLAFNKRFFDLAETTGVNRYLFIKSHYSQLCLGLIFALLGGLLYYLEMGQSNLVYGNTADTTQLLSICYWGAAIVTPLYLLYRVGIPTTVPKQSLEGFSKTGKSDSI